MLDKIVLIGYGLFLILGGYFGFKKGSNVSLIMGVVSGLLIFLGLWIMSINPRGAWIFLSCVSGLLGMSFLMRFMKTQSFMPAGMLFVITLGILIFCLMRLK
jgi:uncharacterized membrane protein (UPF0136 family)